jgi:hypothetical protein
MTFRKRQRVIVLNGMDVPNEAATIVRQMPESYGLRDWSEWWLVRFDDSPKGGGLHIHQSQLRPI